MGNYYRNLYQIALRDRNEIKKELDLYKSLVDMQQDITNEKNKRIKKFRTRYRGFKKHVRREEGKV